MSAEEKQSARFQFPSMVYDMLEEVSDDPKTGKIVSWMPHGRAFKVHRPDDFEAEVMPKYFRERYASFRYLLEQWSFHGLRRGRDRGAYYNVNFIRGQRDKIANVTKEFMEDAMPKYLAPRDEPDFYSMEPAVSSNKQKPEPMRKPTIDRKRKTDQTTGTSYTKDMALPSKANLARKRVRTNHSSAPVDRKRSSTFAKDYEDPFGSSEDSDDEPYMVEPEVRVPVRRMSRIRQQFPIEEPRMRLRISSVSSSESIERKNSQYSRKSRKEVVETSPFWNEYIESPNKDSPILLLPSKPVFSGFTRNLPFKTLKLVVMSSGDFEGEDPFAVKRPGPGNEARKSIKA